MSRGETVREEHSLLGSRDASSVFVIESCGELWRKFASRQRQSAEGVVGTTTAKEFRGTLGCCCCVG
jgi:hypothetical protein